MKFNLGRRQDAQTVKEASPQSSKEERREWRYAWIISMLVHVAVLLVWAWAYQIPEPPVSIVVEFKQPTRAASRSSAARGERTIKQVVSKGTSASSSASEVKNTEAVPRKLNLVRNAKSVSTESSQTSRQSQTTSRQKQSTSRELTLKRSSRYVSSSGGSASTKKSLSGQRPNPATGGSGVRTATGVKGVPQAERTSLQHSGTDSTRQGRSQLKGKNASDSFFNWKNGKNQRRLLAKQETPLPERLRDKGIQAEVLVQFQVDKSGRTHSMELLKSSGYHELDDWTMRYVRTFRFNRVEDKWIYQAEYVQLFKP